MVKKGKYDHIKPKKRSRKAPFYVLADKLLENIRILNEIKECPDCKTIIEEKMKICPKCGNEIKNKITYEENLDYIRAYIQDVRYTGSVEIYGLKQDLKKLKEIIRNQNILLGKPICSECGGTGIVYGKYPYFMFPFNPDQKVEGTCPNCWGKGIIEK